uniref:alanine--tRNA ligase n=1 Tax=Glossina austeni TaxID=7395 RepID=A0A1A9VIR7_GLOAU
MYSSAKKVQRILTSGEIRKTFIDYFIKNHDHEFVRSSPVVPFCDPTVAFVNAGMTQFKTIFLGKATPSHRRITNSQKCIRVGGKHNDLKSVGQDGYHHTFFEMLGNWSFGDYFKKEACIMALDLLRGPYNIDPARLYVTYFGGDKTLGLSADLECFEIWRSLGFETSRILPFGVKDNFWEMGLTGPCGPCTEIHIDHNPHSTSTIDRAKQVNSGSPDLTELWNLVFIEYNRNADGSITQLPTKHVDTGMGFERLTAVLQNKSSNYDTDLFTPLFKVIQNHSKVPPYGGLFPSSTWAADLDTAYRILADHARMVTICLADGMLPDQNQKLRRILRKALTVSKNNFANEKLLSHLVPVIIETMNSGYPEIANKQNSILEIIEHEREVSSALRKSSREAFAEVISESCYMDDADLIEYAGFVPAYRELKLSKVRFKNVIPGDFLYKLTSTYGLTEEHFEILANLEGMMCDLEGYHKALSEAKLRSKLSFTKDTTSNDMTASIEETLIDLTKTLPATQNQHIYNYQYDTETKQYSIPPLRAKVLGILYNDVNVKEVVCNGVVKSIDMISIITDASNFYVESGGQQSDKGYLVVDSIFPAASHNINPRLGVVGTHLINDCVVHTCKLPEQKSNFTLAVGDEVTLTVDENHRTGNIRHHTATHLLNGAIRTLYGKVTYQISSEVTHEHCKLELGLIGKHITINEVQEIEDFVNRSICLAAPIKAQLFNAVEIFQQDDVVTVPGEIYPETDLRLITINCNDLKLLSKELCCGTHASNTQQLEQFCITNLKQPNRARYAFTAVAGEAAKRVLEVGALLKHRADMLEEDFKAEQLTNASELELQKIRHNLLHMNVKLPYVLRTTILNRVTDILRKLKETVKKNVKEFVEVEIHNLLQERSPSTHHFILHYISSSALMEEDVPLQKATRLCRDRPILVIAMTNDLVKARCCKFLSENFNAEKWLLEFSAVFKGEIWAGQGQNMREVCNMRGKRITMKFEEELEIAMQRAFEYATKHVPKTHNSF